MRLKTIFVFFRTFPNKLALIPAKSKENLDRKMGILMVLFCAEASLLLENHLYVKYLKAGTKWELL